MSYESVDVLQKALAKSVFRYAKDAKKAAGRALGTLVEIVNFYLLKTWGYENHIAIERRIPEYANSDIIHNVEFTLHPCKNIENIGLTDAELPYTAKKIIEKIDMTSWNNKGIRNTQLLSKSGLLRNSCTIYEYDNHLAIAYLKNKAKKNWCISISHLHPHPFAMFECKRVGVEEGMKKGPQTIEKAKQGAYVAQTVSSLQRIRASDGSVYGVLYWEDEKLRLEPYDNLLNTIVESNDADLLGHFILTVGIVSNHGNWFSSEEHNKELKILSQSYNWLLFLTDMGLATFVEDLLLNPIKQYEDIREAFISSYTGVKGENKFTKVKISLAADKAIQKYFARNIVDVENWFNVISPTEKTINELKENLNTLASKNWNEILK